ncbi:MAG: sulfite exporter TauE/SafE family protein [Methylotenera sp.]|nr:sulfite exporter TauE/SafE family protein [Methylotenera sp.]
MFDFNLISVAIGFFVGLVLALTGAGGSILAVPLLAFGLNLNITQAAPIGLMAVMFAASIGALQGLRAGIVRYKAATLVATLGVLFAPLGVWLAHRVSNQWLSFIFAIVLIFVARRMWQQSAQPAQQNEDTPAPACAVNPATSKLFWTASCTKRLIATGSLAGFLSGLLGVGGGFVIVPTLRKVSNLEMKSIVATSLAVIALVSASSVVAYIVHRTVDWQIAIPFVLATVVGMGLGRLVSHRISNQTTQRSFAVLAYLVAISLVIRVIL